MHILMLHLGSENNVYVHTPSNLKMYTTISVTWQIN